jgi:hypothetical protein
MILLGLGMKDSLLRHACAATGRPVRAKILHVLSVKGAAWNVTEEGSGVSERSTFHSYQELHLFPRLKLFPLSHIIKDGIYKDDP